MHNQQALVEANKKLVNLALLDDLTGLMNRQAGLNALKVSMSRLQRNPGTSGALVMCDIENFDKLIHSQGYASADDIFCRFTSKLNSLLRPTDWLCRFSGEELMLFVEGTRNQLPSILNRLIRQSAVTIKIRSEDLNLTLNMGCLVMQSHCVPLSIDEILAKVDATLMEAKTTNAGSFLLTELEAKQRNNVVDLASMRGNRDSLR